MDIYITDIKYKQSDNERLLEILNKHELETYMKRTSNTYLMTRVLAREVLANKLNINYKDVIFSTTQYGRPYIENSNIFFNISHSKNLIALAVSSYNVGIDLEYEKERNFVKLLEYLNRIKVTNNLPEIKESSLKRKFYILWTRYESNIKFHSKKSFTPTPNGKLKYLTYYNDGYYLSIAYKYTKNIRLYSKEPSAKPTIIKDFSLLG